MAGDIADDIERILLTQEVIRERVEQLGREIAARYADMSGGLTLVPILSGSIVFLADLIRAMQLKLKIAVVQLSSYRDRTRPGAPQLLQGLSDDVRGRHVLIVDDILDTGGTLRRARELISVRKPASLATAVLLRKPSKAPADLPVDFVGFDIDDLFVVGYGLDYADYYRNYPHIGVLREDLMR